MKKYNLKRIAAAVMAVCAAAAMLTACGKNNDGDKNNTETSSETTVPVETETVTVPTAGTMREVAEGDVFAINKFTVDTLPEGYELAVKSQKNGAQFVRYLIDGGKAQVSVEAANYREDFQDLETFADTACASMKMNNIFYRCDTDFSEPEKTTIAGFDAIKYDYTITQNDYDTDEEGNVLKDEDGKDIKIPVAWYKGRAYYFYSDKDVYYVIFETTKDNWDSSIDTFEQFISGAYINENAENDPEEAPASEEAPVTSAE